MVPSRGQQVRIGQGRPVGQFIGDIGSDGAVQTRAERRARSRLNPHARSHIGDIVTRKEGGVLDEERLSGAVILIRNDVVSLPEIIDQRRQCGSQVSENVGAARGSDLFEESVPSVVRETGCNGGVAFSFEAKAFPVDDKIDVLGKPLDEPERLG